MRFVKVRLSPNKHHLLPGPLPARFLLSGSEVKSFSPVRLFATPWTVAPQAPPSMGFSRREYSCGLPFPSPGHLPDQKERLMIKAEFNEIKFTHRKIQKG